MYSPNSSTPLNILLISGRQSDAILFSRAVAESDVFADIAFHSNENEVLKKMPGSAYLCDIIVVCQPLKGMSAVEFCTKLLEKGVTKPFFVLVNPGEEGILAEALQCGVDRFFIKDADNRWMKLVPFYIQQVVRKKKEGEQRYAASEITLEKNKIYQSMVSELKDPVFICSDDLKIEYMNPSMIEWFGYDASGEYCYKVFSRNYGFCEKCRGKKGEKEPYFEGEFFSFDEGRYFHVTRVPVCFPDGVSKSMTLLRDITATKRFEEEIKSAKEQAEKASRTKSAFLANMSHEIRTPLNAVLGMIELTLSGRLEPDQRENLENARIAGEMLLMLVNDILDITVIESDRMKLEEFNFHLRYFLEETIRRMAVRGHQKSLEMLCRVDPRLPDYIRADPRRLRQVLGHLLSNAIKFTEKGEIVLSAEAMNIGNRTFLHFTVKDTGIGIDKKQMESIFTRFTQGDDSMTRKFGGTGLGTTISKKLVELMGGRIWVESEGESGSVFHFSIDLKPVENPEPTSGFESKKNLLDDFRGASVIIVEDNRTSGEILSEILSEKGLNPLLVSGREELEEKMKENGEKQAISLSVVDVPAEESVFNEIFGVLDKHLGDRGRTLYLVPLGMQDRYVLQQGVFPGCIIEKPVKQDELMESVYRLLSGEITCETDVKSRDLPVYSSPNPLKILLVEDNVLNRHLALGLLKTRGHIVSVARDGREAVESFGKNDFDLILMDVQMPEMDGLEASRRIREMESGTGRRTPVIAMTAHAMEGDRQRCMEAGMDSYITKPFRKETFFEIVETAGSMIDDYPEKERAAEDGKDRPVIEKKTLMELTGGSAELVRELVQIYLEKLPGQIADIRESVEEGDSGKLEFSAHSLKGMSLNLSANIVARKAFELEQMGRNDELEGAEEVFQGLEKDIEILKRALEDLLEEMAGSG